MGFWVFHVYARSLSISGISLGALQAPQHLAPGLQMHLHKAVCEPLPMPICFTGQHPPWPARKGHRSREVSSKKAAFHGPGPESSGGRLGMSLRHHWLSTRRCSGRPLLLFVPRHHMTPSVYGLPRLPIRASGLQGSMGWVQARAFEDTHWHTAMPPSLPTPCGTAIIPLPPASSIRTPRTGTINSECAQTTQEGGSLHLGKRITLCDNPIQDPRQLPLPKMSPTLCSLFPLTE